MVVNKAEGSRVDRRYGLCGLWDAAKPTYTLRLISPFVSVSGSIVAKRSERETMSKHKHTVKPGLHVKKRSGHRAFTYQVPPEVADRLPLVQTHATFSGMTR